MSSERPITPLVRCTYLLILSAVLSYPFSAFPSADPFLSYNALNRHFYQPALIQSLDGADADQMHDYLIGTGLDRWNTFLNKNGLDAFSSSFQKDGFGLRLLEYPDRYYLLPEIGSPNEGDEYRVYEVIEPPEDGDWLHALNNNGLLFSDESPAKAFVSTQYESSGFALTGPVLRVDDFTNRSFNAEMSFLKDQLNSVTILDLRFNGGGRIDYALTLLEALVDGDIEAGYQIIDQEKKYLGTNNGQTVPLQRNLEGFFVLVSRHTASAAEWLASNLQGYGATLLGERTEGKCLIHSVFPVGGKQYFRFAIGLVKPARVVAYEHCDFGLVPDIYINERSLIETDSALLVEKVRHCDFSAEAVRENPFCMGYAESFHSTSTSTVARRHVETATTSSKSLAPIEGDVGGRKQSKALPSISRPVYETQQASDSGSSRASEVSSVSDDSQSARRTSLEGVGKRPPLAVDNSNVESERLDAPSGTEMGGTVYKVCVERQWQLTLKSNLDQAHAKALVGQIDPEYEPLAVPVITSVESYYDVVLAPVIGEKKLGKTLSYLKDELNIEPSVTELDRTDAYLNQLTVVGADFQYSLVHEPQDGLCLDGRFSHSEASELVAEVKIVANISLIIKR